ncbi:hypothetical protein Dsin_007048 [Dipteronia sinensis]|uniref:MBD domain-containing protein n=1 Tax=Dipteronia sinensis TaxID=43782 RepID=A0AAE0AZG6_9ROSI|nr:hypothetical protein Dsin_007048 [Dipteronia sinensis]
MVKTDVMMSLIATESTSIWSTTQRDCHRLATTLAIILSRRRAVSSSIRSKSIFLDNNYPNYSWLLPGWLVEERHMDTGRIYKYFYDPAGSLYYSRAQVLNAWDQSGLVILDDD